MIFGGGRVLTLEQFYQMQKSKMVADVYVTENKYE